MTNEKVKHNKFGYGEVIDIRHNKVTIFFSESKESKTFKYPDIFENFMEAQDDDFKEKIFSDICSSKVEMGNEIKKLNENKKVKKKK